MPAAAAQRQLNNPPIVEVLVDLRASLPPTTSRETLHGLQQRLADRYPIVQHRLREDVVFEPSAPPGGRIQADAQRWMGCNFVSPDNHDIVQARLDGFTFNRLPPYPGWGTVRDRARVAWEEYRYVAAPSLVNRVALRTINRFDLPLPIPDLSRYFRTLPEIAPELPQALAEIFMRLVVRDPASGCTALVTEATVPADARTSTVAIMLDIDVFMDVALEPTDAGIWGALETMHAFRNRIFFSSVTEETLRPFQ